MKHVYTVIIKNEYRIIAETKSEAEDIAFDSNIELPAKDYIGWESEITEVK